MRIKKKHCDQSIQINNDLYDLLIGCKKYCYATHIDAFLILCFYKQTKVHLCFSNMYYTEPIQLVILNSISANIEKIYSVSYFAAVQ